MTNFKEMIFEYHSDAAHGWIKAPKHLVDYILFICVTDYSYEDNDFYYLEEDCDGTNFVKAFIKEYKQEPKFKDIDNGHRSPIRSKRRVDNEDHERNVFHLLNGETIHN